MHIQVFEDTFIPSKLEPLTWEGFAVHCYANVYSPDGYFWPTEMEVIYMVVCIVGGDMKSKHKWSLETCMKLNSDATSQPKPALSESGRILNLLYR